MNAKNVNIQTPQYTPFLFEEGGSAKVGEKAKELGMTKALIITDKGVLGAGIIEPIVRNLSDAGVSSVIFDGVIADPPDFSVDLAVSMAKTEGADGMISVGGGSSIDTSKAASVMFANPGLTKQYLGSIDPYPSGDFAPLIAIPTTAGTGSELTSFAVITDSADGSKSSIVGKMADYAFIDPALYVGMPVKPSIYCAFDALTHAMESIIIPLKEPLCQTVAEKAVSLLAKNIPLLIKNPSDINVRGELAYAATFGGITLNAGMVHLSHAIGHSLGATLHIPHGLACAIPLPRLLQDYAEWEPDETRCFGKLMGFDVPDNCTNKELGAFMSDAMMKFMKAAGLPTLKELGYSLDQALASVPLMVKDPCNVFRPWVLDAEQFEVIMRDVHAQE